MVFVHLRDSTGKLLSQHDGPDEHELTLPADIRSGSYQIRVGMYLLDTMQRLAVLDDQGYRERADEIILKEMLVAP